MTIVSSSADLAAAIAGRFVDGGDHVGIVSMPGQPIPSGGMARSVAVDDPADVADAIGALEAEHGRSEVLVTIPGHGRPQSILRSDPASFTADIQDELTVPFLAARHVAPAMVEARSGSIVFVGGISALFGTAFDAAHGGAMAGLIGVARSLVRELGARGVRVNVVAPGVISTSHVDEVMEADGKAAQRVQGLIDRTAIPRVGTPDEVAYATHWLCSDLARYVTGIVLPVDGGLGMGFG